MTDTTDTRRRASEIKFVVEPALADQIRQWARVHLEPDVHGSGPFGDLYGTTTVYFDTPAFDVFHRNGSFGRAKYRIRRYSADPTVFLERKLRKPPILVKRRTQILLEDLDRLRDGNNRNWDGKWFEQRLIARGLAPVCQLSYTRVARISTAGAGTVRLTLDQDIRVTRTSDLRFSGEPGLPVITDGMILELKFAGAMPALVRRLVAEFRLTPVSISKYRTAAPSCGLIVGASAAAAAPAGLGGAPGECPNAACA